MGKEHEKVSEKTDRDEPSVRICKKGKVVFHMHYRLLINSGKLTRAAIRHSALKGPVKNQSTSGVNRKRAWIFTRTLLRAIKKCHSYDC